MRRLVQAPYTGPASVPTSSTDLSWPIARAYRAREGQDPWGTPDGLGSGPAGRHQHRADARGRRGRRRLARLSPASAAGGLVVVLPVMAALVGVWSIIWEVQTRPGTPRFARAAASSASRQMREDANAKIFADRGGFLFAQRHFFVGTGYPPVLLTPDFVTDVMRRRTTEPVFVVTMPGRRFWTYRTEWAWENQGLTARDVMALLRDKERRRARELERAHVLLDVGSWHRSPGTASATTPPSRGQAGRVQPRRRPVRRVRIDLPGSVRPHHPVVDGWGEQRRQPANPLWPM